MIFFDVTKTAAATHRSGLTRVSSRLRDELGDRAVDVAWTDAALKAKTDPTRAALQSRDWFFTCELFSPAERPGFSSLLESRPCRLAALFHDAIPLKHPHITWPQSVARHPAYMKMLARFDRVWAVSHASRDELLGFWQWQGIERPPPVEVLALGADFNAEPRGTSDSQRPASSAQLLCLGILEPRKNQTFLLDVCAELWREGLDFELHVIGRVNPHFGAPIVAKIKSLRRDHSARLHFHAAAPDTTVAQRYASARATVFPTIAEGCGLPLLESLWRGVPCVHSDLPVLRENGDAGGCLPVPLNDPSAWKTALRAIVSDDTLHARLAAEATHRTLPTWADAAATLAHVLS